MDKTNIDALYSSISLEGNLLDTVKAIPSALSNLTQSVSGFVQGRLSGMIAPKAGLVVDPSLPRRWATAVNYIAADAVDVYTPPGISVPLSAYVGILHDNVMVLKDLDLNVLQPTLRWLAMLVNNPDRLNDLKDYQREAGMADCERIHKAIQSQITAVGLASRQSDRINTQPYSRAYKSHAEFQKTVDMFNSVYALTTGMDYQAISEKVNTIAQAADDIVLSVRANPQTHAISVRNAKALSAAVYDVARAVEFYAHHVSLVLVTNKAFMDTNAKLETIIGK